MKPAKRILDRHGAIGPRFDLGGGTGSDQFNQQSVRIGKADHLLPKTSRCFFSRNMVFFETVKPVADRIWWNGESRRFDLTGATNSAACPWPREKGQDCSRGAARVAKVEVIGSWIIEVNRAFNKTQSEKPDIKVQRALRIALNRSHVMESGDGWIHASSRVSSGAESFICSSL